MLNPRDRIFTGVLICLVLLAITLPFVYASQNAGQDYQFNGFLLNPQDGNSYLAKMYQGWRGDLQFTLPYTAEKGNGTYLFLFYLWLGHLTRLLGLPLVATFHAARVISGLLMYLCLYRFLSHAFEQAHVRLFAFILAAIGSGMGWIALVFGQFTSDFWVAEAYPYLSAFSNPHFPLALALILLLLTFTEGKYSGLPNWLAGLLSFFLAIILPFGVVLTLVILAGLLLWELYPNIRQLRRSNNIPKISLDGDGRSTCLVLRFPGDLSGPHAAGLEQPESDPVASVVGLACSPFSGYDPGSDRNLGKYEDPEKVDAFADSLDDLGFCLAVLSLGLAAPFHFGILYPSQCFGSGRFSSAGQTSEELRTCSYSRRNVGNTH